MRHFLWTARRPLSTSIAATALVSPRAKLGSNVEIGHCAVVEDKATLKAGVEVHPFAHVLGRTVVGEGTRIYSSAVIGGNPQIRPRPGMNRTIATSTDGDKDMLLIGEKCVFREHTTVNLGSVGPTIIGNHVWLLAGAHVGHDAVLGDHVLISNASQIAGHVQIGVNATLGGLCAVQQFCAIGEGAMIGGGAMVDRHVPPHCLVMGNRAEYKGLNLVGLRRRQTPPSQIRCLAQVAKQVMASECPVKRAQELLPDFESSSSLDHALAKQFLSFIALSETIRTDWCSRRASMGIVRVKKC